MERLMRPVDMTIFHDPPRSYGNCYSACIASILELPIESFDEFHRLYSAWGVLHEAGEKVSWEVRTAHVSEIQERTGHIPIHVQFGGDTIVPLGWSIANGPAERGVDHSCVALNGTIIHDPHPSRAGLISIEDFEILLPIIWPPEMVPQAASQGPFVPTEIPT